MHACPVVAMFVTRDDTRQDDTTKCRESSSAVSVAHAGQPPRHRKNHTWVHTHKQQHTCLCGLWIRGFFLRFFDRGRRWSLGGLPAPSFPVRGCCRRQQGFFQPAAATGGYSELARIGGRGRARRFGSSRRNRSVQPPATAAVLLHPLQPVGQLAIEDEADDQEKADRVDDRKLDAHRVENVGPLRMVVRGDHRRGGKRR
mmetsp:Transcript_73125/g.148497  ORF Transcript_73125/g.148497 Transcript_73125/m.148497 type:complete len:200 (+) Transcript_73125:280-879(+)